LPPYQTSREWVVRRTADLLIDERSSFSGPPVIVALTAAVGLVLLVACSNLANLMVARGSVRRHELALRIALGAPRSRLMIDCMAEVLLIVGAGTVLVWC
jgi:ABC-type antimicrobial peptide transport system permease subunit